MTERMQARRNGISPDATFARIRSAKAAIFSSVKRALRVGFRDGAVESDLRQVALGFDDSDARSTRLVRPIGETAFDSAVERAEARLRIREFGAERIQPAGAVVALGGLTFDLA